MPDTVFARLRDVMAAAGLPATDEDVLDVLLLASALPDHATARMTTLRAAAAATTDRTPAGSWLPRDQDDPHRTPAGSAIEAEVGNAGDDATSDARRLNVHGTARRDGLDGRRAARLPGASAVLRGELALGRALRPLKRRVPSHGSELDETATVAALADTGCPQLVMRPATERWLNLELVLDREATLAPWERHCRELALVLERSGVFRHVRSHRLQYDAATSAPGLISAWARPARAPDSPSQLSDPSGRTVVLVVTDGVSAGWSDGRLREVLARWTRTMHVGIVQVLPRRMWAGSGIRTTTTALRPLTYRPAVGPPAWRALPPAVPVLDLAPASVATWSRLLTGTAPARIPVWRPRKQSAPTEDKTQGEALDRFARSASPLALHLAGHLAAYTPMTTPHMELVQTCLTGNPDAGLLAEVLLSGIMEALSTDERPSWSTPDGGSLLFDFAPDVKQALQSSVPRHQSTALAKQVGDVMERQAGHSRDLTAWLGMSPNVDLETAAQHPFARLRPSFMRRLGIHASQATALALAPTETNHPTGRLPHESLSRPDDVATGTGATAAVAGRTVDVPAAASQWEMPPSIMLGLWSRVAVMHAWRPYLVDVDHFMSETRQGRLLDSELQLLAGNLPAGIQTQEDATSHLASSLTRRIDEILQHYPPENHYVSLLGRLRYQLQALRNADPLGELFERVCINSRQLYGQAWGEPPLLIVARKLGEPRDPARRPCGVSARTTRTTENAAVVTLCLTHESFGPREYAMLPRILMHECVSHVPSGSREGGYCSPFAEGFMDWAADYFLSMWASKLDQRLGRLGHLSIESLSDLSEVRHATRAGHFAADSIREWLERERGYSRSGSSSRVARLAIELNVAKRPLVEKDHFVLLFSEGQTEEFSTVLDAWLNGLASGTAVLDAVLHQDTTGDPLPRSGATESGNRQGLEGTDHPRESVLGDVLVMRFERGNLGARELQRVLESILSEISQREGESKAKLAYVNDSDVEGIADLTESLRLGPPTLNVYEEGQGLSPDPVELVVAMSRGVSLGVAMALWSRIVLPELRRRLGSDALGRRIVGTSPSLEAREE